MNDRQLACGLHAYGLTPDVIAEKLECPESVIEGWIKSGPGRPRTVDGMIISALGDDELCATRISNYGKIRMHNISTYLLRMHKDGILSRRQVTRPDGRKVYVYKKALPTARNNCL